MNNFEENNKFEVALTTALKIPGVKVNRTSFLIKELSNYVSQEKINQAIKSNTIEAGIGLVLLNKIAKNIINKRTAQTSGASFLAGLPGGLAMAATIPADTLQFFGVALKIAQELAYLYGFEDLWEEDTIDNERVKNELIIFIGQYKPHNKDWIAFSVEECVMNIDLEKIQELLYIAYEKMKIRLEAYNNIYDGFSLIKKIEINEEKNKKKGLCFSHKPL